MRRTLRLGVGVAAVAAVTATGAFGGTGATSPPSITQIAAGYRHTCAITSAGRVKCWGSNMLGQLGDGARRNRAVPVDVVGLGGGVRTIAPGGQHTCALTGAGRVKCWGSNAYGQLGNGSRAISSSIPVDVSGLAGGVTAIAAGGFHTCALMRTGTVRCWGANHEGQLDDQSLSAPKRTPIDVAALGSGVRTLALGSAVSCAITNVGEVRCLGGVHSGVRPLVGLASGVSDVEPGWDAAAHPHWSSGNATPHACALTTAGGVKCWGNNLFGQLGNGTTTFSSPVPVDVSGLAGGVTAIDSGFGHTCAVMSNRGVKCWGGNAYGQLGAGKAVTAQRTPVDIAGLGSAISAIAAGSHHTCALTTAGRVKCWGHGRDSELGNGRTINSTRPVDVLFARR